MDDAHEKATRFVELLTSNQRRIYAYISMLMLGDPAAADILQDTNLDLWASMQAYDSDRPFLAWAFGFARKRILSFRRAQARSRLVFSDELLVQIGHVFMPHAEDADARFVALQFCLQQLAPQQAELVRVRYRESTPLRALAQRFGDTERNVASRLHRIRKLLARCVKSRLVMEDH